MVAFYNKGDQNIYKDFQYVPQEKYRLGFTAPTPSVEEQKITQTFGIPATNAFTNSGGMGSNAFGYGSPVQEVNVRTFNPQSNDPTGSVANAQTMYNKASANMNNPTPSAKGLNSRTQTLTRERPSQEVMDFYNNQIMDNRQNYQANYNSPYDDTVDLGYKGRDTSTSIQRNRGNLGRAIDFVTDYFPGIGAVKKGLKVVGGLMPENPNGPGGGTYGVAGLSDQMKGAYNTLAKNGMLFDGSSGMKTLTGKNFTGKGYMEGQRNIYDKEFADMTDEEIEALKNDPKQRFKYKQFQESSALFKDRLATEKALREAEKNRLDGLINTRGTDGRSSSLIQGESGGNTRGTSRASDHGRSVGLGHNAGNVRDAMNDNDPSTGSAQGHNQNLRSGGRAGYFFGGRVNFKNGGLASIL